MTISHAASACIAALLLCACMPDSVRPEFEHLSHLTQHPPFTSTPTDYGSELFNVMLHWDTPRGVYVELGEGVDLDRRYSGGSYGEIEGPREQFSARVGYVLKLKEPNCVK